MSATATGPTVDTYRAAFERESAVVYPVVDALESRVGYALAPERYLQAARVLACPVKLNPPNWQHGRVVYAMYRSYLASAHGPVTLLDIGTAKGFSALCALWALQDAGISGRVISLDVIDAKGTDRRNTVAECDGPKTLAQILEPWPESDVIEFKQSTGQKWLTGHTALVHCAFVDGKHTFEAVSWEAALLAERQQSGDLVIFDDVQIGPVAKAVRELTAYSVAYLDVLPNRRYAIARRK